MYSPNPGNEPQPNSNPRLWLLLLRRTSIALGAILLVGIVGGTWWAWKFVHEELAPLVQKNLKQLLGRPVKLGEVENVSFNSLRFGRSVIPATSTDPDYASVQAVNVAFDPWRLLFNRTLELNITLIQPNAYIKQAKDGSWVSTEISTEEGAGFLKTDVETIRFRNADVVLVSNPEPGTPKGPVVFDRVNGVARFLEENQGIRFELSGQPAKGGSFNIAGQTRPASQQTKVVLQGQKLPAATISQLVKLPIDLPVAATGNVQANLQVTGPLQQPMV